MTSEGEDRVKLSAPGREDAVKVLNQALDPSVADTWNPDKNSPKARVAAVKKKE